MQCNASYRIKVETQNRIRIITKVLALDDYDTAIEPDAISQNPSAKVVLPNDRRKSPKIQFKKFEQEEANFNARWNEFQAENFKQTYDYDSDGMRYDDEYNPRNWSGHDD